MEKQHEQKLERLHKVRQHGRQVELELLHKEQQHGLQVELERQCELEQRPMEQQLERRLRGLQHVRCMRRRREWNRQLGLLEPSLPSCRR
ncbi:unnamed protein product [Brassicogethes aeneus]|uniref:Uncharacterized protein n=1 Tax=Brassicogethes aeneus TaxID=1431903 RepID=A0A9P0AR78_BRAAE|nr:unnamed protein product [Brassicogethes aeneus]